jgi:hypothetical protein
MEAAKGHSPPSLFKGISLFRVAGSKANRPPDNTKNMARVFSPRGLDFSYFGNNFHLYP